MYIFMKNFVGVKNIHLNIFKIHIFKQTRRILFVCGSLLVNVILYICVNLTHDLSKLLVLMNDDQTLMRRTD